MAQTIEKNMLSSEETQAPEKKHTDETTYKVYNYRYIIGCVYSLAAIQNVLMWLIFAPLQTTLKNVYQQSITMINLATMLISNISYLPSNFVASYLIDTYGLRFGIIFGATLTTIGLWIRCFCKESFYFILAGQCFAGIAQPFFYSVPQKISNTWFNTKERTLATTVISVSLNIGNAFGAFLPQFFIDMDSAEPSIILNQLKNMMVFMASMGTIVLGLTIILFKEKPPTPPSKSASAVKYSFKASLKALFKDKNSMLFLLSSSAIAGSIFTYSSVIQQLVEPFKINGQQIGNIIFIAIFVGFIGAGIGGAYVNKTKKYKPVITFFAIMSAIVLVGNYFCATTQNVYIFGASFCLYSFLISPVMPLSMETIVEYSFPVAEATAGGLWFGSTQLLATGDSLAINSIIGENPSTETGKTGFMIMIIYQLIAISLLFLVKENLKRSKYEKAGLLESQRLSSQESGERESVLQSDKEPVISYAKVYDLTP